jgi:hypothetical protein
MLYDPRSAFESRPQETTKPTVFPDIVIGSDVKIVRRGGIKGHAFRATLFAYAHADGLWDSGAKYDNVIKPVWMILGCSEHEAAAVKMNLQLGRPALLATEERHRGTIYTKFELPKSAKHVIRREVFEEGVVLKCYLPDLFKRDPGAVMSSTAKFILLADRALCEASSLPVGAAVRHVRAVGYSWPGEVLARLAPVAPLFLAALNRRTRCPLLPDAAFALQVLVGALERGFATTDKAVKGPWEGGRFGYAETRVEHVNALPGVAFKAQKPELEPFLADQVARYLRVAALPKSAPEPRPLPKTERAPRAPRKPTKTKRAATITAEEDR